MGYFPAYYMISLVIRWGVLLNRNVDKYLDNSLNPLGKVLYLLLPFFEVYLLLKWLLKKARVAFLNARDKSQKQEKVDYDILNAIVQADDDRVFFSVKNGSEKDIKVSIYTISRDVEKAKAYWLDGTISKSKIEADKQDLNINVGRVIKIIDLDKEEPSSGSTYTPSPKKQFLTEANKEILRLIICDAWHSGLVYNNHRIITHSEEDTVKRIMKEVEDL